MNHHSVVFSGLICFICAVADADVIAKKPNVVIFLADDSGWGDYSFNGNSNLNTSNIDELARGGVILDRFYVCSVCAPTRAEFLTGRYHPRGGVRGVSTGQERLNLDERTIADSFLAAGYATGAFGKWHNGSQWPYHPNARGFAEYYGFTSGHWGEYFDPPLEHNGHPVRGRGYVADDFTDHAIAFIENARARPFLCYVAFNTPHSPWAVPEEHWQRTKDRSISRIGSAGTESIEQTRCALAMMENLDRNVGRLLRRLDELKLTNDTIVIYFSDNGPNTARWNGGMKGIKGSTDEGGVRSACVIRWPGGGIRPGTVVREIAGAIDLLPTLMTLTGVERVGDTPLDGRDLSPLLVGGSNRDWTDRIIFSHQNGNLSARTQQYRLDHRGALFDMVADPGQVTNVAGAHRDVAAKLADSVAAWRTEVLPPARDDRPFPVGFLPFPRTPLPARDGVPHGTVKRSAAAPNCSYFVNWSKLADRITWDIEVNTTAEYDVEILYTCPIADAGSVIELSFNENTVQGMVTPGWDPPLLTNQDTISRPPAESPMKEFRGLNVGTMRLDKGRGLLTLRAIEIPRQYVMDVRQVNLTLRSAKP
jgi:arylsulfatase A-like enzyme